MAGRTDLRRIHARALRNRAAALAAHRPHPEQVNNGDEYNQPDFIAAHSKGLSHDAQGEPWPMDYRLLLRAVQTGDPDDWERIPLAQSQPEPDPTMPRRKLTNPQSGLAFDLQGPDAAAVTIPPAPTFNSAETAAEMAEEYWMALLRDVNFVNYENPPQADVIAAAASLSGFDAFTGPRDANRLVTPRVLFRGTLPGDEVGPYISQFLLRGADAPLIGLTAGDGEITYGNLRIGQLQDTVLPLDFLRNFQEWFQIQERGVPAQDLPRDPMRRFIRNGRDLAHRVRPDRAYQHYLNAALILMNIDPLGRGIPDRGPLNSPLPDRRPINSGTDPGNPYGPRSINQEGFVTFGDWHILTLLAEVTTRALQAAWYQKFFVHRRIRPEEFGARVDRRLNGGRQYDIHPDLLATNVADGLLDRVAHANGLVNVAAAQVADAAAAAAAALADAALNPIADAATVAATVAAQAAATGAANATNAYGATVTPAVIAAPYTAAAAANVRAVATAAAQAASQAATAYSQAATAAAAAGVNAAAMAANDAAAAYRISANTGGVSFLLSQAYPEGAPFHSSYPSGHAVLAGACVTILKAYFDEALEFGPPDPAAPRPRLGPVFEPDGAGAALVPTAEVLTVGGELNKLASNISLGRNFAGVHWRSDYLEGVKLGEDVAIGLLQEQSLRYNENRREAAPPYFTLTRFNRQTIRIERGQVFDSGAAYARSGSAPAGFLD